MTPRTKELLSLLCQLANYQIAPSKIVGTGYKNSRDVAYKYLAEALEQELLKGI